MNNQAKEAGDSDAWASALKERVLPGSADERLTAYLRTLFAPFDAPTDPVAWPKAAAQLRRQALERIYLRGFSRELIESAPRIVWGETLEPDRSYRLRKLRYEIFPDYWIPALLYEPANLSTRAPVMLNPNGHHWGGKAVEYKQARCINLARRGVIALSTEFIGMGELQADVHHDNIAHLNLTGLAGTGLFYLALKKALDLLLDHPHADPARVGVTGLSGGGWQTIVLAALDPRVTLAVPVSGYTTIPGRLSVLDDIGDLEQAPPDLTTILDYSHLTAMLAPRPALLVLNEYDAIFRTDRTRAEIFDAIQPTYRALGAADNFEFYSSRDPGTHCYEADIRARLYRFLAKHWSIDPAPQDLHRDDEILPELRLNAGLPREQTNLLEIALGRARDLSATRPAPQGDADRRALRARIAEVIHLPQYEYERLGPLPAQRPIASQQLRIGPLTVPVSIRRALSGPPAATLIIDDSGRAAHQDAGKRSGTILVADILGAGENKANERLQMLVEAAGQRLLGIQAAQVHACARYAQELSSAGRIDLVAVGMVASFAGLVAAALKPELFASLEVSFEITTLARLIEWPERYEARPSMFCFGLLEVCDVPELRMLLEDVRYIQTFRHVR